MELRIITAEDHVPREQESIEALVEAGAVIHVRKPAYTVDETESWLSGFSEKCRSHFRLHGMPELVEKYRLGGIHFRDGEMVDRAQVNGVLSQSFHSIEDIQRQATEKLDYVFLSPVFDSISKIGYAARFEYVVLEQFLMNKPEWLKIYALGGITDKHIAMVNDLGFDGAAVLGYIWEADSTSERMNRYKKLIEACQMY